jgi:pantothenate kinase type III
MGSVTVGVVTGSVGVVRETVGRPTAPSPGPAAIAVRAPAAASATPEAARRKVLGRTSL